MDQLSEKLQDLVRDHMRTDFVQLRKDLDVAQALDLIRERQPAGRIIYFYVTDADDRLQGVVPTRRLLLSPRDKRLAEIMITPVISIPDRATLMEACEFFILHKLLAFPVVDQKNRIVGLVDVDLYTREISDLDRRESHADLFQMIGIHATNGQPRSIVTLFPRRFPWLLATLVGGLLAAVIVDGYYEVASAAPVLAFIPLVLALASSIAAQSVSLAVQSLRDQTSAWAMLLPKLKSEMATGSLLGAASGTIAATAVFIWKGNLSASISLLIGITASGACAAALGLAMPFFFRQFNRNPNVAAGPVALAAVDGVTLLLYFSLTRWLLF